jgi:POT family proton-dependent oligopeptide transporter
MVADQAGIKHLTLSKDKKTGEVILLDPAMTISRIFMIFYWVSDGHYLRSGERY